MKTTKAFIKCGNLNLQNDLDYHINEGLSLTNSVHMVGSDRYHDFINFVREKYELGEIVVTNDDRFILEKLRTGTEALWKNRKSGKTERVILDSPKRGDKGGKKFYVFRPTNKKDKESGLVFAKVLGFGDPESKVRNDDKEASKSFLARHKCSSKTDLDTPGWWSCNVHRFWKQLGLKSDNKW